MKAIVTVIGKDRVGITAAVCALLAQRRYLEPRQHSGAMRTARVSQKPI